MNARYWTGILHIPAFLLCLMVLPFATLAQWNWQHPLPQGNPLFTVYYHNTDTVYLAGCQGTILRTNDGGNSWALLNSGTSNNILGISFRGTDLGYFCGTNGTIGRTTDGGNSWQILPANTTVNLNDIVIQSTTNIFTVGDQGTILGTFDGANTWQNIPSNTAANLNSIEFPVFSTAYITGDDGNILTSHDYGVNWQMQSVTGLGLNDSYFFDGDNGFAVGGGFFMGFNDIVLKTTDGGLNWTEIFTPSETTLFSVYFFNADTGIACGQFHNIMRTVDGGMTWNYTLEYSFENYYQIAGSPDGIAYIAGGAGNIIRTTNFGQTWKALSNVNTNMNWWPEPRLLKSGWFFDADSGFVVGDWGGLYSTSDAGHTWNVRCIDTLAFLNNIQFLNHSDGFINAEKAFFTSADGGLNWSKQVVDDTTVFTALCFTDPLHGLLAGHTPSGKGMIARTQDGGLNWNKNLFLVNNANFIEIHAISSPDLSNIFLAGTCLVNGTTHGFVCKSVDGGSTFQQVFNIDGFSLDGIDFCNPLEGYASGSNGLLVKTIDGGINWSDISGNESVNLHGIDVIDGLTAFVCGDNGIILKTTDGGISWQNQFHACSNLSGIFAVDANNAWTYGQMETILHTGIGGSNGITVPARDKQSVSMECRPNPSQESTVLHYSIAQNADVEIVLTDISGKQLRTLYRHWQILGTYNLDIDTKLLQKGMYFVVLRSNNQSHTTKLIKF